jgi:phosphoribosylaminoimidazolecarboxamide formyltransferase/IMP cyclohydrolase
MVEIFTEVVIAPEADDDAVAVFAAKKNLRLLVTGGLPDALSTGDTFKSVAGGFLVQSRDDARITASDLKIVTQRQPTNEEVRDMLFAFTVGKHVKSNAIVYARARPDPGRRGRPDEPQGLGPHRCPSGS